MLSIQLLQPETVEEATRALAEHGDEAKVIAGGTALVIMLQQGLIAPSVLVSLGRITDPALWDIRHEPEVGLRFGALATIRQGELSPLVLQHNPTLAHTFGTVANVRVRGAATIGGNMTEADYASDPPGVMVAMRARVRVVGPSGEREIPLTEFFQDFYTTSIEPDEVLTEVVVPDPAPGGGSSYLKYTSRSSEDRPCVGASAVVVLAEDGTCQDLRVVISAVAEVPQELPTVEEFARGQVLRPEVVEEVAAGYGKGIEPLSDLRGSGWYRQQVIRTMVRRAIAEARGRCTGPGSNGPTGNAAPAGEGS